MQTRTETTDFWASVPSVDDPAEEGRTTTARDEPLRTTVRGHRRTFLKAAAVLGGGLALNVLSWLPPARTTPAYARCGTEYYNCTIYDYDGMICTGAPYSRDYCGSDGWFLQYSGTCFSSGAITACNSKNAWRWTYGSVPYRCADGMQYWCGGSAFLICSWSYPVSC